MDTLPSERRPSTATVIRNTVARSGIRSLYKGLSASLMRQMTYSLVRIGSYEELKRRMSINSTPTTSHLLLAACVAGAFGAIAGNPAGMVSRPSWTCL
jgi:solute carrier family 25 (mitochondrial dicarboxylate transporter), member 10